MATTKEGIEYNVGDKYTAPSGAKYTITSIDSDYIGVDNQISMERNDLENDFDKGIRKLHVKTNSMNKYNIEVGDVIQCSEVTYVGFDGVSITKTNSAGMDWKTINSYLDDGTWKLTKKSKGKIIGYTLLKDTPGADKGTKYLKQNAKGQWIADGKYGEVGQSPKSVTQAEWFSPIYEEVKPTSVVVKTNAGDVTVSKASLSIAGENPMSILGVQNIFASIKQFSARYSGYEVKVETFKVGCKTFHVSDIPKLEEAIKQVS